MAAAISLFGFNSGAALATVVGVLIEVPVMLSVVWIVNRSKGWYESGVKSAHVRWRRQREANEDGPMAEAARDRMRPPDDASHRRERASNSM